MKLYQFNFKGVNMKGNICIEAINEDEAYNKYRLIVNYHEVAIISIYCDGVRIH